ncbi:MAG: YARHG domain-containing protein [Clostridiales bacterium]|nr:YARHG domain-containing protein [Clostridiales bacterium]
MDDRDNTRKNGKRMVATTVIVGIVVVAVIISFILLRRRENHIISAANNTGQTESAITMDTQGGSEEITDSDSGGEGVYLIEGNEQGSNRYERVDKLSYTDSVRYTKKELSQLDSYGLLLTRNEIYARHGCMFNDQALQEYFELQDWYVAQTAPSAFDDSCFNEVESYNIDLITSYEMEQGS